MARKPRLEFPGACYHVINRGNYRAEVLRKAGAKAPFKSYLFETCVKSASVLHAFTFIRNHYHLVLETPGKLGDGNAVAAGNVCESLQPAARGTRTPAPRPL